MPDFVVNLAPGERLLWSGQPRQGIIFRTSDFFMVPFSLLWCGFVVFWEASVLREGAPIFFVLWGIPFLLAGLYITVGRFLLDASRRARTAYGVTPDRALIVRGREVESIDLRTLGHLSLRQKADGSGTIYFAAPSFAQTMYQGTSWPGLQQPPSFEMVDGAENVYSIIRDAQRRSPQPVA